MNLKTQEFWIRTNNLIKEKKITQEYVCKECDIVLSTYKGWVMRGIYPNGKQVVDIAKLLEVSPEYLIYGEKTDSFESKYKELKESIQKVLDEK